MKRTARFRAVGLVAMAGAISLVTTACTVSSDAGGSTGDGGALRVSFATAPSSLDPAIGCTGEDRQLTNSLYTRMLQFGSEAGPDDTQQIDYDTVQPYLAKSWEASADGKQYTFTLNSGWTFPSGDPMDADAVKYSLERTLTMNQCGAIILNDLYSDPALIKSIEAPDATTVVVNLTKADPQVLSALADTSGAIVDPKVVDANGGVEENAVNSWMGSHSAGGGAFTLESYGAGSSAVLVANPSYGGPAPASDRIEVTWTSSASTQALNVQNGSADIAFGLSGSTLNSLGSNSDVKVVSYDDTQTMQMTMPNDKAPWTNEAVREAVVKAIPMQDIIDNVVFGFGKAYYGPIPPSMPGYSEADSQPVAQNVEEAKQLMADSGVKTPINVTLDILAGDQNQQSIATVVQSSLKEIGITVKIRTLTSSAWSDAIYSGESQAALRLDGPAIANAGYYLQYDEDCSSVGSYNTGYICIPDNTSLLEKARSASDQADSDAAYAQITKNWVAEYPRVNFYQSLTPFVLSSSVSSFYFSNSFDMRTWARS